MERPSEEGSIQAELRERDFYLLAHSPKCEQQLELVVGTPSGSLVWEPGIQQLESSVEVPGCMCTGNWTQEQSWDSNPGILL